MSDPVKQVAMRILDLREISDYTVDKMAEVLNVPVEEYRKYESGEVDMPISFLVKIGEVFHVDMTELLTGEAPRLNVLSVTRAGRGQEETSCHDQYVYRNLAYNFVGRKIEPMYVVVDPEDNKTLTPNSQDIVARLDGGMTITTYINVLDPDGGWFSSGHFLKPDETGWHALFEITSDPVATLEQLRSIYAELSGGLEMKGDFLDQTLRQTFASQIRLTKIVGVFTCVAILISLLGLVAMSTYFVRQREVEIAVRKVYGSENGEILVRLVRSFLVYVGIAFVFAAPVAWWALSRWLSDYAYRVSLSPWMPLAAGGFCLVVAFCAVIYQSWQAANRDPVKGLKGRQ